MRVPRRKPLERHPRFVLVTKLDDFWSALARADGDAMAACYTEDASFRDPVFDLEGAHEIAAMWRTLMPPGNTVRVTTGPLRVDGDRAEGAWEAVYTFPTTGRTVHNRIRSTFTLRDGLIHTHRDRFPAWKWTRMAFGPAGWLLGWTPILRRGVGRGVMRRGHAFARKR